MSERILNASAAWRPSGSGLEKWAIFKVCMHDTTRHVLLTNHSSERSSGANATFSLLLVGSLKATVSHKKREVLGGLLASVDYSDYQCHHH